MATSQDFVNWVCGPDLDPSFLAYLLKAGRSYIRSLSSGAIHQTVYMPTVESFSVCVPSIGKQRTISESLNQHLLSVERLKAADAARLEAIIALSGSYLRRAFGSSECNGWPRRRLGELLATPLKTGISRTGTPSSTKRCLTLSAVRNGILDLAVCKPADVSDAEADSNWVLPGAFYVIRGNGNRSLVGRGAFAPLVIESPVLYPDLLIQVLTDSEVVTREYLRFAWDSIDVRRDIEGRAHTAAGIYKISQSSLVQVQIPVPPLAVQRSLAAKLTEEVAGVTELQRATVKELREIDALPPALLRRAFSGEL
jgi:type I restriction enzyme S subunit